LKRRRGYSGQPDLVGFNFRFLLRYETKRALNAGIRQHRVDAGAHYLMSKLTASDSIGG